MFAPDECQHLMLTDVFIKLLLSSIKAMAHRMLPPDKGGSRDEKGQWGDCLPQTIKCYGFFIKKRRLTGRQFLTNISTRGIL